MAFRSEISFLAWIAALVVVGVAALSPAGEAFADSPSKLLVLPFWVDACDHRTELETFARHVDASIRATLKQFGEMLAVESEDSVRQLLGDGAPPSTDSGAIAFGEVAKADLLVYGSLQEVDSRFRMKGAMRDMRTARASVTYEIEVGNIHRLPEMLGVFLYNVAKRLHGSPKLPLYRAGSPTAQRGTTAKPAPSPVSLSGDRGPWRSPKITPMRGLEIGDLDGDRRNEIVFLGADGVTISRFENGSLRTLTQFSQRPQEYLSAQAEDVDGDGICELLLCYQTPKGIESSIIRYKGRDLRTVRRFPNLIVRAIRDPSGIDGMILVGQRTDSKEMFNGEMVRFGLRGEEVTKEGTIVLPPGTLLLSYVSGCLGKEGTFVQVILNQDQRLMVFDAENRLLAHVTQRLYGLDRRVRVQLNGERENITLPGRLLISDTDGDGENELLVIHHAGDRGSVVEDLVWKENQLTEKWKTIGSGGLISDFRIRDFKNEGSRSLVVILVKSDYFLAIAGKAYSIVYAYDLGP